MRPLALLNRDRMRRLRRHSTKESRIGSPIGPIVTSERPVELSSGSIRSDDVGPIRVAQALGLTPSDLIRVGQALSLL